MAKKSSYYSVADNVSKYSNPGNSFYPNYERVVNSEGQVYVKQIGGYDLYDEIQEAGVGVTLKEMLQKYDTSDVVEMTNSGNFGYVDTTDIPGNAIELKDYIDRNSDVIKQLQEYNKELKEKQKELKEKEKEKEKKDDEKE